MIFSIGVFTMILGWALAWHFGDWNNLSRNWCDKVGGALFGIGLGMCLGSLIIAAIKYLP